MTTGDVNVPSALDVSVGELRQIVRLALELRDFRLGDPAQREHFLSGTSRLISAHVSIWLEFDGAARPQPTIVNALDQGWSSEKQRQCFLSYLSAQGEAPDPALPAMARAWAEKRLMTFRRRNLVSDGEWYGSDHVDRFRRGAELDDCIYSIHPEGEIQSLAFHRPWGERPYSERERALIYALHAECSKAFEDPLKRWKLSPRQREAVLLLSRGLSEKQVAHEMGISVNTLHTHVREVHRRLKVQSRSELLAVVAGWSSPTTSKRIPPNR